MNLEQLEDPRTIGAVLVAIATFATVLTVAMPLVSTDKLDKRMRSVASERERIARASARSSTRARRVCATSRRPT